MLDKGNEGSSNRKLLEGKNTLKMNLFSCKFSGILMSVVICMLRSVASRLSSFFAVCVREVRYGPVPVSMPFVDTGTNWLCLKCCIQVLGRSASMGPVEAWACLFIRSSDGM
ncbi:uncharacterized protein LOC131146594 [Malania oleifera]|uniref:uncharacterized protein LOC131146594 n=1 Tax=Malania oleifera TaxID=397392 RepID=UPI0025ADFF74|nr:uncharacterized protein LOC131146594 [Malania oleifera]